MSALIVNLIYLCIVWGPFTLGTFTHDLSYFRENTTLMHSNEDVKMTAFVEEIALPEPKPVLNHYQASKSEKRTKRWAKVETPTTNVRPEIGSWTIVFPRHDEENRSIKFREPLPLFMNVDCGFQDCITTSSCYSLAFIAVIHAIISKRVWSLFIVNFKSFPISLSISASRFIHFFVCICWLLCYANRSSISGYYCH